MDRQAWTRGLQISIRAAVGAALAIFGAQLLHLDHPIYAMLAVVIVTELSPTETRRLARRRVVATVVGAGVGGLLVSIAAATPWTTGLGILGAMVLCNAIWLPEGARVAGYVCGIVMMTHGADPWRYALFRLIETVVGIVVAVVLSFVPKLLRFDAAG